MPETLPPPVPDEDAKRTFILNQAITRLGSTITAYDALTDKVSTLLAIAVPLLAGLAGYAVLSFSPSSPPVLAALAYAGVLAACVLKLWNVVKVRPLPAPGRSPIEYATDNVLTGTFADLQRIELTRLGTAITKNETQLETAGHNLKAAMRLFLLAPLCALVMLALTGAYQRAVLADIASGGHDTLRGRTEQTLQRGGPWLRGGR